ncbi:TolB amino-terminal domain-containing protein [Bradyrhizobium brasilense]|uniref:TolB amino-terminal domain-containing protein n=1 Tax=Bradyrhizobium brasilense TaxID=1419277 RepID=A0A1G7K6V8_9BRAD|nr:adenylate/guanylate cyclase domain-containing protein [Bradyrhizobium brasilense]SDF32892.1 TolB amino-terminal domain-containing protein [Bradyrhizobium brasilense]
MVQERPSRIERRLSAILAADVAGYSRLMHDDEEATHAKLRKLLASEVEPAIASHGGRIVKNTGDGFLAEFPSAVEAVRAALRFQARIHEVTAADPEQSRIAFRVGVNIGDVIVEPHDIFGDGVNIAARLESISAPGGICISSSAYDQVRGKIRVEFADLGEQHLKNIARPIRAYAAVLDGCRLTAADETKSSRSTAPRLSVVVLPFANLSGDPGQEYFADGVTESLTTDLSRIGGSFIIGRHTAFTYKNKALDLTKIGRDLNVRYVLEGSVQRSVGRIRVNVQLVDAETGNHLWTDRFDKPVADLFDMQDEIVSRLASAVGNQLVVAEARRAERSPNPDATDLIFQGRACFYKGTTPKHMAQARELFERALAINQGSVGALLGLAVVDIAAAAALLTDDRATRLLAAETSAVKTLALASEHAEAHLALGLVYILTNRVRQGIAECQQALLLNRNLADAHTAIGLGKLFSGQAGDTEGHVLEALRLSPRDLSAYWWTYCVGRAKVQLGEDVEATDWLRRSIEENRNFPIAHFVLAAALALTGAIADAQSAANAGLALDPGFTIRRLLAGSSSDDSAYIAGRERLLEGMRLAGVPED